MAKIENSLTVNSFTNNQNNIDVIKYINNYPSSEQSILTIELNNLPTYTISEIQSLWFVVYKWNSEVEEVDSIPQLITTNLYKVINTGKGTYGVGGIQLTQDNLLFVSSTGLSLEDIENNPLTQVYTISDLEGFTVSEYINQLNPAFLFQDVNIAPRLIKVIEPGNEADYLFLPPGRLYGQGELQTVDADFQLLNSNQQNIAINPYIFSNEDLSLANRKGDILYGILDQFTEEEITLQKIASIPTGNSVDNIIYFQLGSEIFKRNFHDNINLKWFGAKGDGITDDTDSLKLAMSYIQKNRILFFGGDYDAIKSLKLFVPHGVYILSENIIIPTGVEIQGESENGTIFKTADRSIELFTILDLDNVAGGNNTIYTTVSNLSIWGFHADRNPFEYKDTPNLTNIGIAIKWNKVRLQNLHVSGFEGSSIECDSVYYIQISNTILSRSVRGLSIINISTSVFCNNVEIRENAQGIYANNSYACYFNQCVIENNIANFLQPPDFSDIAIQNSKAIGVILEKCENFIFQEVYTEAQVLNYALFGSNRNIFQNGILVPLYSEEVTARQIWFLPFDGEISKGNRFINNKYASFDETIINPYYISGIEDLSSNIIECLDIEQFEKFSNIYEAQVTIICQSANLLIEKGIRRKMDGLRSYFEIQRPTEDILYNTIFNKDTLTLNYFDGDNWLELNTPNYITQITITTSTNITTSTTDINGLKQNGRNTIIDNSINTIDITTTTGLNNATYFKKGSGTITFVAGSGRTLVQMDSTNVLDGVIGSTASIIQDGVNDYLYINNK